MQLTQKNNKTGLSKIVLAGNPNVGKSVIFNKLTNSYAEVSNYPGSTVEISKAVVNDFEIIDSPGIYGIGEFNEEETIAKNIIIKADKVINVVSALSLERDLFLTYQLIDLGIPFIVALNQTDEAQKRGICIDINKLEEMLGVKIFPTVAVKNQGIDALKKAIGLNIESPKNCTPELAEIIKNSGQNRIPEVLAFENNPENTEKIYTDRRKTINEIVKNCVSESSRHLSISEKIGRALLNPVFGLSSSLFVLYFLYKFIGVFVAGDIVDFLENSVILKYYTPWITGIVENTINSHIIKNFTVGEFGILTMSVQYIVGVLIPLIFAFNFFMAILEDSGYLPRLAVLTDRFLSKMGLNGRAIIPIILGFGCTTMATVTTRILGSKRERIIATALLGISIPCSAQLGIIIGLIAAIGGLKFWLIYLATIASVFLATGFALNRLLSGKSSPLLIDLSPIRIPSVKNVFKKCVSKTWNFILEATPLFLIGSVIITAMQLSGGILVLQKLLEPLTVSILHLPKETALIFIMGLIRRDFAAAGLVEMVHSSLLNPYQTLVSLVVLTLFVPCIIAVTVLYKERGIKEASLIWLGSWVVAFGVGGLLTRILELFI